MQMNKITVKETQVLSKMCKILNIPSRYNKNDFTFISGSNVQSKIPLRSLIIEFGPFRFLSLALFLNGDLNVTAMVLEYLPDPRKIVRYDRIIHRMTSDNKLIYSWWLDNLTETFKYKKINRHRLSKVLEWACKYMPDRVAVANCRHLSYQVKNPEMKYLYVDDWNIVLDQKRFMMDTNLLGDI